MKPIVWLISTASFLCLAVPVRSDPPADTPRVYDKQLRVDLFAASPDIVHPVGLDFDAKGRLLVIESHTHFPPVNYKGPKHDRIRVLEDTDGDGKADRFSTFFEGTKATMDIATHPDGWVYLATRSEILRVRDTDGDGKADVRERVVFLDTKGDYPHNGLSGLCFDSRGGLFFGMGENLGATYKLIGTDGVTITDQGEGGNVFHCSADGKKLRRVATGFWNPFGVCRDIHGRLFAVDNDPDAMPPCRLMHVVEGADFGYQFRYGRSGRHPFQAWNGQLPGTLPMMSGTGEAPCEVLSYESDDLPRDYLGNLLVTSWADHRVERYILRPQGSSFTAERKPFVQGGRDFRPAGLAVAPDGSLFVGDWVKSDYTLHGKGAIWHVRPKEARKPDRPKRAKQALTSLHRPLRESAAPELASDEAGKEYLRGQLKSDDVRIRAAALTALIDAGTKQLDLQRFADDEKDTGLRAQAVRALAERGADVRRFLDARQPAELRREAIPCLRTKTDTVRLLNLLVDADPFIRHAAIHQLAANPDVLSAIDLSKQNDPRRRIGLLLAHRPSGRPEGTRLLSKFLLDHDDEVRFLAAKWIADLKVSFVRLLIVEALGDRKLNLRLFTAYSTALARLDGKEADDARLSDSFLTRFADEKAEASQRVLALRMVPANHPRLTPDLLGKLLGQSDVALQREAVLALGEHPSSMRKTLLRDVIRGQFSTDVKAHAIAGVAEYSQDLLNDLLPLARGNESRLRDEALRALVNTKLSVKQREELVEAAQKQRPSDSLLERVLGEPFHQGRPPTKDLDAWMKRLEGPADIDAGRRVFFHSRLGVCSRCHRIDGRGNEVGPDLSTVGRNEPRHILEAILQPSNLVAPHYQVWHLETSDGKIHAGMLTRTYLDEYTYLDAKGNTFKLKTGDIVDSRPLPTSIMPDGLVNLMTDQELRDLMAYLTSRK